MTKRKIYVASSWRNVYYEDVVKALREAGHDVYDFRNPPSGDEGFKWSKVSEDYMEWSPAEYRYGELRHVRAGAAMRTERTYGGGMVRWQGMPCAGVYSGTAGA